MKSVLISIQPYWIFLIIAKKMGWSIDKEKTVEVRKNYPKRNDWNKTVKIYCSKDKKSFAKIPKEYQALMERLLGKVIGEFVCDRIEEFKPVTNDTGIYYISEEEILRTGLIQDEILDYADGKNMYHWQISDLVIYVKPKKLSEFYVPVKDHWETYDPNKYINGIWQKPLQRPPQSWCYVEEVGEV